MGLFDFALFPGQRFNKVELRILDQNFNSISAYTKNKYGTNNITSVHHYVNSTDTSIIEEWDATRLAGAEIQAVTNLQYEEELNDKKRQIFYLHKNLLKGFIQQYKRLVE